MLRLQPGVHLHVHLHDTRGGVQDGVADCHVHCVLDLRQEVVALLAGLRRAYAGSFIASQRTFGTYNVMYNVCFSDMCMRVALSSNNTRACIVRANVHAKPTTHAHTRVRSHAPRQHAATWN